VALSQVDSGRRNVFDKHLCLKSALIGDCWFYCNDHWRYLEWEDGPFLSRYRWRGKSTVLSSSYLSSVEIQIYNANQVCDRLILWIMAVSRNFFREGFKTCIL
jgi:hypothetical protein